MNNIFKRFAEWVTSSKDSQVTKAIIRLTMYYTAGVVIIIALFSFLVFSVFTRNIDTDQYEDTLTHIEEETLREEIKENLFDVIIFFDILFIVLAIMVSYFLSQKTLAPLEQARLQQKRFVTDAAHELRNPLAVMKAGTEFILNKGRTIEEYQKFIREFQEEVDRLTRLSDNLLFLAQDKKIVAGTMTQFSVTALCQSMIQKLTPYADTKNVQLIYHHDTDIQMYARKEDIIRILLNLIKNAIDYNIVHGTVSVHTRNDGDATVIDVCDTGIGIAQEHLDTIFERFFKVDQARMQMQYSGTGLGLCIIKDIVDQYKGTVRVTSQKGKGSTFTVHIPLKKK